MTKIFLLATKARSNEADSKPSQMPIRKSGMVSSITSVQKRKDINPINPGILSMLCNALT